MEKFTTVTPGAGLTSMPMIFVGKPAPASSSSVASKIELAGRIVRSRNLAEPLMALSGVGGGVLGPAGRLTQPDRMSSDKTAKRIGSVQVPARTAFCGL